MMRPCLDCGVPSPQTRCTDCAPTARAPRQHAVKTTARGYGNTWQKLSRRARRTQPWCLDCGARDDLTTDHSPEAWERHDAGLPIRLEDVAVVCRPCNSRRGQARPPRGDEPTPTTFDRRFEAKFGLQMKMGANKRSRGGFHLACAANLTAGGVRDLGGLVGRQLCPSVRTIDGDERRFLAFPMLHALTACRQGIDVQALLDNLISEVADMLALNPSGTLTPKNRESVGIFHAVSFA